MSKKLFLNQTFALDDKDEDGSLTGKFKGVAYSGKPIGWHSGFQNLITDVSKMEFKKKIPIFLHHDPTKIAGYAVIVANGSEILVQEGQISKSTQSGQEVLSLAKEGFEWEFSIGYSYEWDDIEEIKSEKDFEVNGYKGVGPATIIKKSWLQEVSFVPIGADKQTRAEIFKNQSDKGNEMKSEIKFDKEAWEKFACGCGGTADSSLEELAEVMIDEDELQAMKDENEALKQEILDLKAKIDEAELEQIQEEMSAIAKEKGIELSAEKIAEYSSDKTKAQMFIEFASSIEKPVKKIDSKFANKVELPKEISTGQKGADRTDRLAQANELIKLGRAKTLPQALLMVQNSK